MKLVAKNRALVQYGITVAFMFFSAIVIDALNLTLSCEAPCTDITQEGLPPTGRINITWYGPELGPTGNFIFYYLVWGGNLMDKTQTYLLELRDNLVVSQGPTGTSTLIYPDDIYIPPGNHYFVRAEYSIDNTGGKLEYINLGPYRFNEAYDTYPIPISNPEYNFTVTVDCPNGVDCSEGVTTIYADEGAVVRWTLPTTEYEYADVRLSWGNPSMYFASTRWIGDIYMNDQKATYPTSGGFRATDGQDGISFTNITEVKAPPGRDYYMLVFLSNDPEFSPYKNHDAAYSTRIQIESSRSRGSNDQTGAASGHAGPKFHKMFLGFFISIVLMYYCQ